MKRILILLTLIIGMSTMSMSQNRTGNIPLGGSYVSMNFTDADTLTENQASYILQFNAAQNYPTTQDFYLVLDSIDAPNISVQLTGSKFGNTYANIESAVTWAGTSGDTTIVISNSTENRYRFYRATFTRNSGDAKITAGALKLFYE